MRRALALCVLMLAACSPPPANVEKPKKPAPALSPAEKPREAPALKDERAYGDGKTRETCEYALTPSGKVPNGDYRSWWPNGKIATEGRYAMGDMHGRWMCYFENGQTEREANFDHGMLQGVWKVYAADGKLLEDGVYSKGRVDGTWHRFNADGELIETVQYQLGEVAERKPGPGKQTRTVSGEGEVARASFTYRHTERGEVRDGDYESWYSSGAIQARGQYKNGKRIGRWNLWHESGKKSVEAEYNEQGELHGRMMVWYDTGMLDEEGEYKNGLKHGFWWHRDWRTRNVVLSNYLAGSRDGPFEERTPNGDTVRLGEYSEGNPVGHWVERVGGEWIIRDFPDDGLVFERYQSGRVKSRGKLVDGKRDGQWVDYYDSGQPARIADYQAGKLQGLARSYYTSGRVWREATYEAGNRVGAATENNEDGLCSLSGSWDEAAKAGFWTLYDFEGNELKQYRYANNAWQENPKPIDTERVKRTQSSGDTTTAAWVYIAEGLEIRDGSFFRFLSNGRFRVAGEYTQGMASGEWSYYAPDGKVRTKITYVEGDFYGKFQRFHPNGKLAQQGVWRRSSRVGHRLQYQPEEPPEVANLPLQWGGWGAAFSVKDKSWVWYDRDGNETDSRLYENGKEK